MQVWLERFVLLILAGAFLALVIINVLKIDWIRRTGLGMAIIGLSIFVAQSILLLQQPKGEKPNVKAIIHSRIVGRLYARTAAPPPGETVNVNFSFQEIFYEWSVSLIADRQSVASLKVDNLQQGDVFRVEPEGATTEKVPETALGFRSAKTDRPDYYALIVKVDDLTETQPLVVTVRRSITAPLVESDLIKIAYVRSATSNIEHSPYDVAVEVERLKRQAQTIAEWKHPPRTTPLPIHPPGNVSLGDMQSAVEVWCEGDDCKKMTMGNLVARWNRVSP
jgi:hypothetical protein